MADAVSTDNVLALAYAPDFDCPKAGDIINAVRDLGPDPVYNEEGEPQPDEDGSFLRASTLYRWLSNGIRELARRANWVVQDWTAVPQVSREGIYKLPYRFANIDAVFCNKYRLAHLDEVHTIYPSFASAQPLWYATHHRSDHVELALWPVPNMTDPRVTLMHTMDPLATTIDLSSTAGFMSPGWLRIENEIIQYSALVSELDPLATQPGVRIIRRGVGGSAAALHFAGVAAEHCAIWVRGWRAPNTVRQAIDCVEVPFAFQAPLEVYLLSKYREAEQDRQGAVSLMQEFVAFVEDFRNDPTWQQTGWPSQVAAYGTPALGGLAYGRVILP
jgi:hypothetical protein